MVADGHGSRPDVAGTSGAVTAGGGKPGYGSSAGMAAGERKIAVGEKVPLELTERERDLIMKHTFAGNDLT